MIEESMCLFTSLIVTVIIILRPIKVYLYTIINSYIKYIRKNIEIKIYLYQKKNREIWMLVKKIEVERKKKYLNKKSRIFLINNKKKEKENYINNKEKKNISDINNKNKREILEIEEEKIKKILIKYLEMEVKKIK